MSRFTAEQQEYLERVISFDDDTELPHIFMVNDSVMFINGDVEHDVFGDVKGCIHRLFGKKGSSQFGKI